MTITSATVTSGTTTNDATIALTFTADKTTTNFTVGDITVTNGTISDFAGSGTTYTATFTPAADGACTIDVGAGAFTDIEGDGNTEVAQFSWTKTSAQGLSVEEIKWAYNSGDTTEKFLRVGIKFKDATNTSAAIDAPADVYANSSAGTPVGPNDITNQFDLSVNYITSGAVDNSFTYKKPDYTGTASTEGGALYDKMSGGGRASWIYVYWYLPFTPAENGNQIPGEFKGIDIKYTKHATATNNIRDGTEYVNNFEILSANTLGGLGAWEEYNMFSPEITITAENSSSTTITSGSTTNDSTIILKFTSSAGSSPAPFYFPNGSSDITVTNGTISNLAASSSDNTGVQEYTATFTPTTPGQQSSIQVEAYKVEQAQGGANQESASNTFTWTYDNVIPQIGDLTCEAWNGTGSEVTVEFSENVYNTSSGSGNLEASDFTLTITGGTATNPVCQAIAGQSPTNVWILTVSYTGTANGTETLTVNCATSNNASVWDLAGNPAATNQTDGNNEITMSGFEEGG